MYWAASLNNRKTNLASFAKTISSLCTKSCPRCLKRKCPPKLAACIDRGQLYWVGTGAPKSCVAPNTCLMANVINDSSLKERAGESKVQLIVLCFSVRYSVRPARADLVLPASSVMQYDSCTMFLRPWKNAVNKKRLHFLIFSVGLKVLGTWLLYRIEN